MTSKKNKHVFVWIIICVVIGAFVAVFFNGEFIYMWVITPFCNQNGQFDYGIMWAAFGAIGTIVVSGVAIWQTSKANSISKNLMELENNKCRPYIKLGIGNTFFINKKAYGFSEKIRVQRDESAIKYQGLAQQEEQYKNNINCFWPIAAIFFFNIENLGESSISSVNLKRFLVLNNGIGVVKGFTRNVDTSLFSKESKTVVICVQEQVPINDDGKKVYNRISKKHDELLQLPIRFIQIEMTLEYTDIFGRTFFQEYTIRFSFDLQEDNQSEYNFLIKDSSVEHHIGQSPYGPRIDE